MSDTKVELMLHHIRLRIINLLNGRQLTPHQMSAILDDIAHATLYRHIKALADGGVLDIVEERQIRGTIERVYTLKLDATCLTAEDVANLNNDEHENYFTTFLFSLVGDFRRYLQANPNANIGEDFVRYNKVPLYLNDIEANDLAQSLITLIGKAGSNPPTPDRKRYLLTVVTMPDADVNIPLFDEES